MSTTHPHTHDYREPAVADDSERGGASAWLWALLILALVAAPAWWWIRNSQQSPPAPSATLIEPDLSQPLPAAAHQRPAAMVRHTAPKPAATTVRDHDARPLASNPVPAYPPSALRSGIEGSVTARLQVDANGRVSEAEIVDRSGVRNRDLDRAVLSTVRAWRFEPAMRDGHAVASSVQLPVDFKAQ